MTHKPTPKTTHKAVQYLAACTALVVITSAYTSTASARLLFSNEADHTQGDSFTIDFDDNADGDIELRFGSTDYGSLLWSSGSSLLTATDDFMVLGTIWNPTLSGTITFGDGATVVGLDASDVTYEVDPSVVLPSGLAAVDVAIVDDALDELWKEVASLSGDISSGADIAYLSGVVEDNRDQIAINTNDISNNTNDISNNADDISNNADDIDILDAFVAVNNLLSGQLSSGSFGLQIDSTYQNFDIPETLSGALGDIDAAISDALDAADDASIGLRDDVIVREAEFEGVSFTGSVNDKGTLESIYDEDGSSYKWSSRQPEEQEVTIISTFVVPEDFDSFRGVASLEVDYKSANPNGVISEAFTDVVLYNRTSDTFISLTGASNLQSTSLATASIVLGAGSSTVGAGDELEIRFRTVARKDSFTNQPTAVHIYGYRINYNSDLELAEQ